MAESIDPTVATADRAAEELREGIVTGALPPGTPLREVSLAAELGVSRNTLREALRLLTTEGLVSQRLHKGAVVSTMSADRIRDIYLVRRTLELRAVEESGSATPAALTAIDGAVRAEEQAEHAGDWREVGTASLRFHCAIVATLGSPMLDAMFRGVTAQQRLAFAVVAEERRIQQPWVERDREICDLIHAGYRAAAGRALREYLDDSQRVVLGLASGDDNATPDVINKEA
ncbi:GntR family transcriptional regulator [Streptomyces malaysiensis]|uniref:GntR family transcriptional regulator n=1 Tax=Streptomyces malaysiensis TaxID=92644 RepID=UPI002B2E32FA|nr:GntR family transcriptional regulator [Streptomyces malaysiensis]